ncbi:NirD/YgiW/YdeI family stress tolerance protein [Sutterella sp.]|uniref:NirD/YgiW/YdeI family stress tolerance protein n=1 Tax=Sutterella sp. TaxID=1981025 RepID=UPI0026E04DCE|nr:NirD/YgiW/YdeI family stress tolerance protein [Sutterella sp.]MDO5530862.1 NirD/YgiW/YdeI family stress tolerance protein [Sutterella sp.]
MTRNSIRLAALASIAALSLAAMPAAQAGGPQGFEMHHPEAHARAPQGFGHGQLVTVDWVLKNGSDDQMVTLRGRFTEHIRGDKYEFVDEQGNGITAELDHDRDWSMVHRGALVEISAEIDRDWNRTELDVRSARPLGK